MDELSKWQSNEIARQLHEAMERLESSGTLASMELAGEILANSAISPQTQVQMQAVIDSIVSSQMPTDAMRRVTRVLANSTIPPVQLNAIFAEVLRTSEIIEAVDKTIIGVGLQFQATYAGMIASLSGLHRQYAGIGTTFTVMWGEEDADEDTVENRKLILPANDTLALGDEATADLIKVSLSASQGDSISALLNSEEAFGVTAIEALDAFKSPSGLQNFAIRRTENLPGLHSLELIAKGDRACEKINAVHWVAHGVLTGAILLADVYTMATHDNQNGASTACAPIVDLGRRRPGRKVDPENIEAYLTIIEGNKSEEAHRRAFALWCDRKGIRNPGRHDRNAFKKAMQRMRSRGNPQAMGTE